MKKALQPITDAEMTALGFNFDSIQDAFYVSLTGFSSNDTDSKKFFVRRSSVGVVASAWIEVRQGGFFLEINLDGILVLKDIETQLRLIFGKGGAQ